MFDKLATYIEDTPLTTLNRKYYNGEDNIKMIPLVDVLEPEEVTALNDVFDMSFKTEVEEINSSTKIIGALEFFSLILSSVCITI